MRSSLTGKNSNKTFELSTKYSSLVCGQVICSDNHWRIEGGGQGGLAPPPPKIG